MGKELAVSIRSTALSATLLALLASGCPTARNPKACANRTPQCEPGFVCKRFNGASMCVPSEGGGQDANHDGQRSMDPRDGASPDAVDGGIDVTPPTDGQVAPSDGRGRDTMTPPPDTGLPQDRASQPLDATATADVPGCTNACTRGHRRCGPSGGVQDCVVGPQCSSWGPETPCPSADHMCKLSGTTASCECRSTDWKAEQLYAKPSNRRLDLPPSVTAGRDGELHAVFIRRPLDGAAAMDPYHELMYGHRVGGRWAVSEITSWFREIDQPQVGVDGSGVVHVTFVKSEIGSGGSPTKKIYHAVRNAMDSWAVTEVVPAGEQSSVWYLDFAVNGNSLALVHGTGGFGPCGNEIRGRSKTANMGGWSTLPILAAQAATACTPAIAVDSGGRIAATFFDLSTRSLRLTDGTVHETVEKDLNEPDRSYRSRVAIDGSGGVHVLAGPQEGLGGPLRHSYRPAGQASWQQAAVADYAHTFDTAVDSGGGVHVVFSPGVPQLEYASRSAAGNWSTTSTMLDDSLYSPEVAVAASSGAVHVLWTGSSTGNLRHAYRCINR